MLELFFSAVFCFLPSTEDWVREIGVGDSGIVVHDGSLYVSASDTPEQISVLAITASNGEQTWRIDFNQESRGKQDVSNEYPVRAVATPVLAPEGNPTTVSVVDYSGRLRTVALASGKLLWECDLMERFSASPVQYGFASGGIAFDELLIVPVGGPVASVVAFKAESGEVVWESPSAEIGYACPIVMNRDGHKEVVVALKDLVRAIDPRTGVTIWEWSYPTAGLTNAPTPIVVGENQLLIAGQGCDGTRLIEIKTGPDGAFATERWHSPKHKPFYCNSIVIDGKLIGFSGSTTNCVDLSDGKMLWQKRGFTDANVFESNGDLYIVRGDGQISRSRVLDDGLDVLSQLDATFDRYWAPPLLVDNKLYLRGRTHLLRIGMDKLGGDSESQRSDIGLTAMAAMYGELPPATRSLIDDIKSKSDDEVVEQYSQYRSGNPALMKKKLLEKLLAEAKKAELEKAVRAIEADLK